MITTMHSPRRRIVPLLEAAKTKLDEWYEAQEALREQAQAAKRAAWKAQDQAWKDRSPEKDATLDNIWVGYVWRAQRWDLAGFARYRRRRHHALTRQIRWMRRHFGIVPGESMCIKTLADAHREGPPLDPPHRRPSTAPDDPLPEAIAVHQRTPVKRGPFMNVRRLLHQALVVPAVESWAPRILDTGTVIAVLDATKLRSKPSPIGLRAEHFVAYSDEHGKLLPGWLAPNTAMTKKKATEARLKMPLKHVVNERIDLKYIDLIRETLARRKMTFRALEKMAKDKQVIIPKPILRKAIRELGGVFEKTDGQLALIRQLISLLGGFTREGTMAAKKTSKATRARKQQDDDEDEDFEEDDEDEQDTDDEEDEEEEQPRKSKKSAKKGGDSERRSLVCSVGHQLLTYAVKVKADPTTLKLAKRMSQDQPLSGKQYNQVTEALREALANTPKIKEADKVGLQKAIRGVRMCAARVA